MGFYTQLLAFRRLTLILAALAIAHLLMVAAAVYLVVRYLQFWAIPAVLWLPLTSIALRWTTARLKNFYDGRSGNPLPNSGLVAKAPPAGGQREMLSNVAEEIAVATGETMPRVAVCESPAMNAFIAFTQDEPRGRSFRTVVFTSAMAERLNRNELLGVVAHLHAHRRNFVHMFSSMTAAMYLTVFIVADLFLLLNTLNWHFGGSGSFSTGPLVVLLSTGIMVGPALAAAVAQHYILRHWRFHDDLKSLELTRDPESLIGALENAAAIGEKLKVSYDVATAHFYFDRVSDPARKFPWQRLATHPGPAARAAALRKATGRATIPSP